MPQDIDDEALQRLVAEGVSQREIARQTGIPRATVQNRLKRLQVHPVHRGTPLVLPSGEPKVDLSPQMPAELDAIKNDLLAIVDWWRARHMRRVDPRGPQHLTLRGSPSQQVSRHTRYMKTSDRMIASALQATQS